MYWNALEFIPLLLLYPYYVFSFYHVTFIAFHHLHITLNNFNACSGAIMSIVCSPRVRDSRRFRSLFSQIYRVLYVAFVPFLWALPNGIAYKNYSMHTCTRLRINDNPLYRRCCCYFFSSSSLYFIQFYSCLPFLLLICRLTFYDRCFIMHFVQLIAYT